MYDTKIYDKLPQTFAIKIDYARLEVFTAMKIQIVAFQNVDILPHHYTASLPRRSRLACSNM
jgi:hypothetical protein